MDAAHALAKEDDLKLQLDHLELANLLDGATVTRLARAFGPYPFNQIKLRRVAARGQCINFHMDTSLRTMQVPLNSDSEYEGGRLVFATAAGLCYPPRPAGSHTIHDNTVVHGVTQMMQGTRYGLFLLWSPMSVLLEQRQGGNQGEEARS